MQTIMSINAAKFAPRFLQREGTASAACTADDLVADSESHRGTGGVSEENGGFGFRPAFLDAGESCTARAFRTALRRPSIFSTVRLKNWWRVANECGRVAAVKAFLISGFVRFGRFYTRDEAAAVVSQTLPAA